MTHNLWEVFENYNNVQFKPHTWSSWSHKDVPAEFTKVKKAVLVKKLKKANDDNDDLKNKNEGLKNENSNLKKEVKDLNKKNDDLQKLINDNKKLTEKVSESFLQLYSKVEPEREHPPRSCTKFLMVRIAEVPIFLKVFDPLFQMQEKSRRSISKKGRNALVDLIWQL